MDRQNILEMIAAINNEEIIHALLVFARQLKEAKKEAEVQ